MDDMDLIYQAQGILDQTEFAYLELQQALKNIRETLIEKAINEYGYTREEIEAKLKEIERIK